MIPLRLHRLFKESFLLLSYGTVILFLLYSGVWLTKPLGGLLGGSFFAWLFGIILFSSFAVVRHAEALAEELGEPYGTLILTLTVTGIEVIMIAALMIQGGNPTLARDTMFSVVMILLGGVLGGCLLIGGFRFREQEFNLKGEKSFMGLILPLSVFVLILPNYTTGGAGFFSPLHASTIALLSLTLYVIFLAVQTYWHREFFMETALFDNSEEELEYALSPASPQEKKWDLLLYHTFFLVLYIPPVILLAKKMAILLSLNKSSSFLPTSTRSALEGLIVAILILAPESMASLRAAWNNQMQRSVNLLLGSALATISLTVPAVLGLGLFMSLPIHLGLNPAAITLLAVTLGSCLITFSQGQTNLLQGAIHLFLFVVYILMMFQ